MSLLRLPGGKAREPTRPVRSIVQMLIIDASNMVRPVLNLRNVDLNLLVALDALLAERSVSGAGRRIGLIQSAMSAGPARLRIVFRDPLFVGACQGQSRSHPACGRADHFS